LQIYLLFTEFTNFFDTRTGETESETTRAADLYELNGLN